ncbi:FAD-dependent oxidoreductase [Specibacter cremeus]|uniref:FAD-dependent oxidoreductase n=1 Tax=Specibacter cremeus TaxID=1629051 RepID=UPI000F79BDD4|nr:FAD-dependent oxidoreductase [Specibacter cremeus]
MTHTSIDTQCCIAGGGPAGTMLGLLLARAGVDVVVLEKHADFFRDFRGDTIHPSTLDLIDSLGLRARFEAIPHSRITTLDVVINGTRLTPVNFSTLRGPNRHIALMPQWDFLTLLAEEAALQPGFRLLMDTEADGVLRDGTRIAGVHATGPDGDLAIHAPLTIAADGRASAVRASVGLVPRDYGVPADVLWFRLPAPPHPPPDTLGYVGGGTLVITIPRPGYFQMGVLIPKGAFAAIRDAGLPAFRTRVCRSAPFLAPVVPALADWEQVKLLSIQVNRLHQWWVPGLLCIGDAAHAMSPVFGVGVNYAVQDAVAAARLLAQPLRMGADTDPLLARIQNRRERPVRLMQPLQLRVHAALDNGLQGTDQPLTPWQKRAVGMALPLLRPVLARLVGRGFRPEKL